MDEAFARRLDLLRDDVHVAGAGGSFRRRMHEALGSDFPVHAGLPPPRSVDTLMVELKAGDLHRPDFFADLKRRIRADGRLWIVLPRKDHAQATEFPHTWDEVHRAALRTDLVDDKATPFSDELTAVRFVIRRTRRDAHR